MKININRTLAFLLLGGSLCLGGCKGDNPTSPTPCKGGVIIGTVWQLTAFESSDSLPETLPPSMSVVLEFHDSTISGDGPCNAYGSGYHSSADTLTIGAIGATKRYCGESTGRIEQKYFDALAHAESYCVNVDTLRIYYAGRTKQLRFVRRAYAQGPLDFNHLAGTRWEWFNSYGGIGGWSWTPQTQGFTCTQYFRTDSICEMYFNDKLTDSARYTTNHILYQSDSIYTVNFTKLDTVNRFRNPLDQFYINYPFKMILKSDTLVLDPHLVADGYAHQFVQKR